MTSKNKGNQHKQNPENKQEVKQEVIKEQAKNEPPKVESKVCCPLCSEAVDELLKGEAYAVCKCKGCGVTFQEPRPSKDYLIIKRNNQFKDALIKPHGHEIKKQTAIANEIMQSYHQLTSQRAALLNAFGKQVLEIGCELGFRLRAFTKYGWTIQGIDTSKNAVEYAKACALDVLCAGLEDSKFKDNQFDLIVLHNSLGKLADINQSLTVISRLLKPKGLVYLCLTKDGLQQFDELNMFGFDQVSSEKYFKSHGFELVDQTSEEHSCTLWFSKQPIEIVDTNNIPPSSEEQTTSDEEKQ